MQATLKADVPQLTEVLDGLTVDMPAAQYLAGGFGCAAAHSVLTPRNLGV